MRWVANLVYFVAGLIYLPFALYNAAFVGKNRSGWGQRFGRIPARPSDRTRVWVHAVSLGEVNATPSLVAALKERLPGAEFVVTKEILHRVLHLKWSDETDVAVMLREKSGKTKVIVSHEKKEVTGEVKQLQDYWSAALNRLNELLGG